MSIIVLNANEHLHHLSKPVELVKLNGKYYIELEEYENSDSIVELTIALATENQILKERIEILQDQLNLKSNLQRAEISLHP